MVSALVAAYVTVLLAELVGDRTLYSMSALAARFRLGPLLVGAAGAFVIKMGAAVFLGRLVATLPPIFVSLLSAGTFISMAIGLLLKRPRPAPAQGNEKAPPFSRAALVGFGANVFSEWGDGAQLAAAALVARGSGAGGVWAGATLAMVTKAALGATLGIGLRRIAPHNVVRIASVAMCTVMAVMAAFRLDF